MTEESNKFNPSISAFTVIRDSTKPPNHPHTIQASSFKQTVKLTAAEKLNGCRLGMDSHADITCVGKHARILEVIEGQTCTVRPFNDSYSPIQNVQTINAAFAAETEEGETVILRLNQALDFRHSMEHSILCTNQARHHDVIIDDVPHAVDFRHTSTQSIIFPAAQASVPLHMHGPVAYANVRYPTDYDLNNYSTFILQMVLQNGILLSLIIPIQLIPLLILKMQPSFHP